MKYYLLFHIFTIINIYIYIYLHLTALINTCCRKIANIIYNVNTHKSEDLTMKLHYYYIKVDF